MQERLDRYIQHSQVVPELIRGFGLPELGQIKVETRALTGPIHDAQGRPTPVWLAQGAGGTATALLDATHDAFTKLGLEPSELLLTELTAALKVGLRS